MSYALVLTVPLLIAVQAPHLPVRRHRLGAQALNIFLDQHALLFQRHVQQGCSTLSLLPPPLIVCALIAALVHFLHLLRTLHHLALS